MLDNKIRKYAIKLKKRHEYPSYVSGAKFETIEKLGKSGEIKKEDLTAIFVNLIESKNFGKVGDKYLNSSIGFCAEQIASNKIIKKHPATISKISVGSAIRPKTLQFGKKCVICKSLF